MIVLSRLTRLRKQRRQRGLCAEVRCTQKTGDAFRCEAHEKLNREAVARWRKRQKQTAKKSGARAGRF